MERRIVICQGEFATSDRADTRISTVLGSCVSCCLWDPLSAVGGMNHILLAGNATTDNRSYLAGVNAMELLINDLLKIGARRDRLKAKVFGGARMISGLSEIGQANAEFIVDFLESEGIELVSRSLGGDAARHLLFWPTTGVAKLKSQRNVVLAEAQELEKPAPAGNGLELF